MKYHRCIVFFNLILILLTACSGSLPTATATATPTATPTASPLAAEPPTYPSRTPIATITPLPPLASFGERSYYTLMLLVDYEAHIVHVAEGIHYPNQTNVALMNMVLAVEPNLWPGCFVLQSLRSDREIDSFDLEGQALTVNFHDPLPAGDTVTLTISFTLNLPRTAWGNDEIIRNLIFGYTNKQMNLLDWYPFVVPYVLGDGWLLHDPGNYGEHLVYDPADFDVLLLFSQPTRVPQVAAPAQGEWTGSGWSYHLENARTFALSLSPDFQVLREVVNDVTVQSYFFNGNEAGGEVALNTAVKAMEVYSSLFAPYPHEILTVVQGDFIPSMEYDGLVYVGFTFYNETENTPRNYLVVLTAHEVAHQWWFALVANDQALEPWLDEALATYSERIFFEKVYPQDVDWWQETRLGSQEPFSGWVDTSIYDLNRNYMEAVYLRGAEFLGEIRARVGDQAFFATLNEYAVSYAGRRAKSEDFFHILGKETPVYISDIIGTYFRRSH